MKTLKLEKFATRARKIDPETEALDELCQHYLSESWIDWADRPVPCWPLTPKTSTTSWAINREWLKEVCVAKGFLPRLASTDDERKQCVQEEVERVVKFLVELKEWCRLNELALPNDCDPSKWKMLSIEQRETIYEGLATNSEGKAIDPLRGEGRLI